MFFKPKLDSLQVIYKQSKLSADLNDYLRRIEQGRKETINIEDFLNNVIELKELTQQLETFKIEPTFSIGISEVTVKDDKFFCRELYDKTEKKKLLYEQKELYDRNDQLSKKKRIEFENYKFGKISREDFVEIKNL